MAVVTSLAAAARGVEVCLDGAPVGVVSVDLVGRWALFSGRVLDDEELARLMRDIATEAALVDARALLRRRVRSRAEIERRLGAAGHGSDAAAAALHHLTEAGLVDDADFARRYVADKRGLSRWGEVRIRRGLAQLGIDADIAARALAEGGGSGDDDELTRALAYVRRKGAPQGPPEAAKRRAYQALLRRGFAAAVAAKAVRVWAEDGQDDGA